MRPHVRSLGLAVALAGCRPALSEQPISVAPAASTPAAPAPAPAAPAPVPAAAHEHDTPSWALPVVPDDDEDEIEYEVWGNVVGIDVDPAYGSHGLGRLPSMGAPPEHRTFTSLPQERGALQDELVWVEDNIEVFSAGVRRWKREQQQLRAQTPVDADELALAEHKLEYFRSSLEHYRGLRDRYRARLDEVEDAIEDERRRRREMIEAGQCPAEPCPPGTTLPGTLPGKSGMERR
jgi:hypothetical protein